LNHLGRFLEVYSRPAPILAGLAGAGLFFALMLASSGMIVWGAWVLNPLAEPAMLAIDGLIAALFGANIGVLLDNARSSREAGGGTQMTTMGALAALMTSSCPFCQPFVFAGLGLGCIGAFFSGLSLIIALFSIILLSFSLKKGLDASGGACALQR
jgi:hypothetical protein